MKLAARIILGVQFALMIFFTFYQFSLGNPFSEGIHPGWVTLFFCLTSGAGFLVVLREK